MLSNTAEVKISDFGHAGIFQKGWDIFSTSLVGGMSHISPEQITGQSYSGEKIDIWSLGVILYEILTAKPPFAGSSTQTMLDNILKVKYDMPDFISKEAKDLISNLLLLSPEKRLSCQQIQQHSWMKIGNTENPELTKFKIIIKKNYELWKKPNIRRTMCTILQEICVVPLVDPETETEEPIPCKYGPGNLTCNFIVCSRDNEEYFLFSIEEGESREFLAIKIQLQKRIKQKEKLIHYQHTKPLSHHHENPRVKIKSPTWSVFLKNLEKIPQDKDKKSPRTPKSPRDKKTTPRSKT